MNMTKTIGMLSLKAQKYAPQLLMGFGAVTFVETVVLACKATVRASEVIEKHKFQMDEAKVAEELADPEDGYDIRKEKAIVYAHTAADLAKVYAPAISVGVLTLGCFFKAHNLMQTRYLGAVAAYNVVSNAFHDYRSRVIEEAGVDADRHYRYGTEYETVEITTSDEKGKVKTKKETIESIDSKNVSDFSAIFDRHCPEWDQNYLYNIKWLRANETAANDILNTRGHIFLNEVYDMIGLPHTPQGAVTGWIKDGGKSGDGFVSFGLDDPNNESAQRLINGEDNVVLLDFNVDGIIFDKI